MLLDNSRMCKWMQYNVPEDKVDCVSRLYNDQSLCYPVQRPPRYNMSACLANRLPGREGFPPHWRQRGPRRFGLFLRFRARGTRWKRCSPTSRPRDRPQQQGFRSVPWWVHNICIRVASSLEGVHSTIIVLLRETVVSRTETG